MKCTPSHGMFAMLLAYLYLLATTTASAGTSEESEENTGIPISAVAGGFGAFTLKDGWLTESVLLGGTTLLPLSERLSLSPVVSLAWAPRTGNIGLLGGCVLDYVISDNVGMDIISFAQLDHDPWLAQHRGNGFTTYAAGGVGTTILVNNHLAVSPSMVRVWNLENAYPASWSPGLLLIYTP